MRDYPEDSTIEILLHTRAADGTPTNIVGGVFAVRKDSSTVVTAGITTTLGFGGVAGLTRIAVDASADAAYTTGSQYQLIATAGTVDGETIVGECPEKGFFTIEFDAKLINATAAANLQNQYDGTGLTGDEFPATQLQVGSISSGAGGISTVAAGAVITTGSQTLTYTNTQQLDDSTHDVADDAGNTDFYYEFDVGTNGVGTEILWEGYANSNGDSYTIEGFDWISSTFKGIGSVSASNGSSVGSQVPFTITNAMTGTGANSGLVRWRVTSSNGTNFSTDRILCEYTSIASENLLLDSGTLQAATSNTATLESGAPAGLIDSRLITTGGTGAKQAVLIVDQTGDVVTVRPAWAVTPNGTTNYDVVPANVHATTIGGSYTDDAVHIGPSGSVTALLHVDGINTNPIDEGQITNARIVATDGNLSIYKNRPSTSYPLNANYDDWEFEGVGSTVDTNGQSIAGSRYSNMTVTGVGTGSGLCVYRSALLSSITNSNQCAVLNCALFGTFTMTGATSYRFQDCAQLTAAPAIFNFTTSVNQDLLLQHCPGDYELQNMGTGTDTCSATGCRSITINANCTGGTLTYAGDIEIIDNSGGAVTIVQGMIADIIVDTDDLQSTKAQRATATGFSSTADVNAARDAILTEGGSSWTTGAGGSAPSVVDIVAGVEGSASIVSILADTDELQGNQGDWATADLTGIALTSDIAALNDFDASSDDVAVVVSVTNRVTANVDQIDGNATAATNLQKSALAITAGAAIAGTLSTTQMSTNLGANDEDAFKGLIIKWTSGALSGQASDITASSTASLLTYTATTASPASTDTFVIL